MDRDGDGGAYDALGLQQTALLHMATSVPGVVLYLAIMLSYWYVPNIKAQHPAVDLVIWHVVSGLMTRVGFIVAYCNVTGHDIDGDAEIPPGTCRFLSVYTQFWALASCLWYLMLAVDLFVALVNPWMGYTCKSWAYHGLVWTTSAVAALLVLELRLDGLSSVNICWIQRSADPHQVNRAQWILLFSEIIGSFVVSLAVLLFASIRFVRRQKDVTYRTKRRILVQHYRYLAVFAAYWSLCGALYYADYSKHFHGPSARSLQIALDIAYGSYPLALFIVWILNTDLCQYRSGENTLTEAERGAEHMIQTEHFSAALRKDLMRYTTAGIRCSINDTLVDNARSPLSNRPRLDSLGSNLGGGALFLLDEGDSAGLYSEKKRLAATVYNGEYRYYEKLGFTDYAPRIFQNIREACGIVDYDYEKSFADTLLERASEGKSGMLFYFTSDRKYLVKTMTKREHSFLLRILPFYHQYILKQPNTLLCRFLGCHSMQLPVGWNRMFFVVMENVFADGPVDERYDLKGIFHQTTARRQQAQSSKRQSKRRRGKTSAESVEEATATAEAYEEYSSDDASPDGVIIPESEPLLRRGSRSSLRYDSDFVCRRAFLRVTAVTRANLLAQITTDCGFLQQMGVMDYSFLLGIQNHTPCVDAAALERLAHNAVVAEDQTQVYHLGFVDILQHFNFGWKVQHWVLSTILDKTTITALPPAEYALRFLGFIHSYLLRDPEGANIRSYGSVDLTMLTAAARAIEHA